jgi:hydrogenase expression/formation protein HypD
MKYLEEYRDGKIARNLAAAIAGRMTQPWTIMEICGGQTHAIVKYGIDELLPPSLTLVHGPGCPVCVTPIEMIDRAIEIASKPGVVFCSFGDMLRVPGTKHDLFSARARGADVRVVYSPLDAVKIAVENPDRQVVFFGVGFETTAPTTAMAVHRAHLEGIRNFSLIVSHVLVPPAIEAILSSANNRVQGFLAAGHVCTVMGYTQYHPLAERFGVPIVVTGFEPVDILQGVLRCVELLEEGRAEVDNAYLRVVREQGNEPARDLIRQVFEVVDRKWRGIGEISSSGLALRSDYADYDAERRFEVSDVTAEESPDCIAGLVLQGARKPHECPAFGVKCTPERPLGAPMVSSEGACSAYYRYRKLQ